MEVYMKKIENHGNMPKALQLLAKDLAGMAMSTVYECESALELENLARDKKCELTCTLDPTTERGFLVGFEVSDSPIATISGTSFLVLSVYFAELKESEYRSYKSTLSAHRNEQEDEMRARQSRAERRRAERMKKSYIVKETS